MNKISVAWIACLCLVAMDATAQQATEIYTPIGESPGLSDKVTVIGTIESVDEAGHEITIASDAERWTAEITDETHIWLDRSKVQKPNEYGAFTDLKPERRVELLYVGRQRGHDGPAEWIKVQSE